MLIIHLMAENTPVDLLDNTIIKDIIAKGMYNELNHFHSLCVLPHFFTIISYILFYSLAKDSAYVSSCFSLKKRLKKRCLSLSNSSRNISFFLDRPSSIR